MSFILFLMSVANTMFYPLVIGTIIAVIIEQIFRSAGDESSWEDKTRVNISTMIRKFLYRWAWNVNIIWFLGYFIVAIMLRTPQSQMPDMIWKG